MDWEALRSRIRIHGMRNSNCIAIAPTATISNIIGVGASIEPEYQNIYVKSNLSGEFTVVNEHLVAELKKLNLWDEVMVADLKYFDGSLATIDRIPADLRNLYATAFEVDAKWIVEAGARRQKWIDQAQSLNIYMAGASGKKLDETYKLAWLRGLEDHVLPAHARGDLRREIDRRRRRAERGAHVERRCPSDGRQQPQRGGVERHRSRSPSSAASTTRHVRRVSRRHRTNGSGSAACATGPRATTDGPRVRNGSQPRKPGQEGKR